MYTGLHAEASLVGSLETTTWLLSPSTATQSEVDGHDRASRELPLSTLLAVTVQAALAPSAGSVEVTTLPASSTAAQKVSVGQETPLIFALPSTLVDVHDAAFVGSVEVTTLPASSAATQRAVDGQDTLLSW